MVHAIGVKRVRQFVESLFEDDLHAKRALSLSYATAGVLRAGALGIHAIGRGLALARRSKQKHAVKQVDRLVGNEGVDVWALFGSWVPYLIAERTEIWVSLDWTQFDADDQYTLCLSLVTSHGRTTPLMWLSASKNEVAGHRLKWEEKLLHRLREVLPTTVSRVVILADRGFASEARWEVFGELGFEFIIRIAGNYRVTDGTGREKSANEWAPAQRRTLKLEHPTITQGNVPVPAFVAVKEPAMKEPWCLVTSLGELPGKEIVQRYGRRFTIEESFRDIKDLRFGMGLSSIRVSTPQRRDRLLLLSAMAVALLTLLGAAGEAVGIDRHFKTNTSKKRQYSLFRQGCDYYEFLPDMREEWAIPLITKFAELLAAHPVFSATLGHI
jgi:Transposase DDE domain